MSASLLKMFSQWRQGALQELRSAVDALAQKKGQRAKVTAAPEPSDDDDSEGETQVCPSQVGQ